MRTIVTMSNDFGKTKKISQKEAMQIVGENQFTRMKHSAERNWMENGCGSIWVLLNGDEIELDFEE